MVHTIRTLKTREVALNNFPLKMEAVYSSGMVRRYQSAVCRIQEGGNLRHRP